MEQERQRRQEEVKIKHGKAESSNYNMIPCKYRFACVFSLLGLACMVLHVVVFYHGMGFSRCDSVFGLALPIPNSLDEMGSHTSIELDCRMDSKLSGVDLRNDKHMA